jgi:hypothetical protein
MIDHPLEKDHLHKSTGPPQMGNLLPMAAQVARRPRRL